MNARVISAVLGAAALAVPRAAVASPGHGTDQEKPATEHPVSGMDKGQGPARQEGHVRLQRHLHRPRHGNGCRGQ